MDEKTKLYVFSKREVALIFLFMFLIALTSFVFGVKIGKSYSYGQSGLEVQDRERVDLLSGQEEAVNEIVDESKLNSEEPAIEMKGPDMEDLNKKLEAHIKEETSDEAPRQKLPQETLKTEAEEAGEVQSSELIDSSETITEPSNIMGNNESEQDQYVGKYTIQLGSHRSGDEAQAFAEGFRVRGYNPIVNEVDIPGRGVWYRVSLGAFDSITEAKDYVKKENSLFQGQEYVFVRFE